MPALTLTRGEQLVPYSVRSARGDMALSWGMTESKRVREMAGSPFWEADRVGTELDSDKTSVLKTIEEGTVFLAPSLQHIRYNKYF